MTMTAALFLEGRVLCVCLLVTPRELCKADTPVDQPGKELSEVTELAALWNGDSAACAENSRASYLISQVLVS